MNKNKYESSWVKIYRSMLSWEWYTDVSVKTLFLHLLLTVNRIDQRKFGILIPAGSVDKTQSQLAAETGLSVKQVRGALEKLKMTGEVAVTRHAKFSVITVLAWASYQEAGQSEVTSQGSYRAVAGQSKGDLYKNIKNIENIKEKEKEAPPPEEDEEEEIWYDPRDPNTREEQLLLFQKLERL